MKRLYKVTFRNDAKKSSFIEYIAANEDLGEPGDHSYASAKDIMMNIYNKTGDLFYIERIEMFEDLKVYGYKDGYNTATIVGLEPNEVVCKINDIPPTYKSLENKLNDLIKLIEENDNLDNIKEEVNKLKG